MRTLITLFMVAIFMNLPKGAASDMLTAPMRYASLDHFSRYAEPCDGSIQHSNEDVIFGFSPLLFYRSANSCEVIEGEQFCKTVITSRSNQVRCLGSIYSNGEAWFGTSENQRSEIIRVNTPSGRVVFPNEEFRGE